MRAIFPAKKRPSAIGGKIMCQGVSQSATGSHFNLTEKIRIKIGATTNAGMQTASMARKLPAIILPSPAPGRGEKSKRQADAHRKAKGERAKRHRNRQSLRDDVVDGVVAVFERDAEVAMRQIVPDRPK